MTAARRRLHDAALRLFAERGSSEVTISELAATAGIARGTVYNNIDSLDDFFDEVSRDLAVEMRQRMLASFRDVRDPAQRLSDGLRFFVRRAHDEPGWGRFVARFGSVDTTVRAMWSGPSMDDVRSGIRRGRFSITATHESGAMAMISGTTIAAMWMVIDGHETWRTVGTSSADLLLRSLGIPRDQARDLATRDLPELVSVAHDPASSGTALVPAPSTAAINASPEPATAPGPTAAEPSPSPLPSPHPWTTIGNTVGATPASSAKETS